MGPNGSLSFRGSRKGGGHLACLFFGSAFQSFRYREDTATGKAPRELGKPTGGITDCRIVLCVISYCASCCGG